MMMSIGLFLIIFSGSPNLMPGKVMESDASSQLEKNLKQGTWIFFFFSFHTTTESQSKGND